MLRIIFGILFTFGTLACNSQNTDTTPPTTTSATASPVEIDVVLNNDVAGMAYLELINERNLSQKIDSVEIKSRQFSFDFDIPNPAIYQLNINNEQLIGLILEGGEKLTVTADGQMPDQGIPTYKIEGSPRIDKFNAIAGQFQAFGQQRTAMEEEFQKANPKRQAELRTQYQQKYDAFRNSIKPQITELGTSLAGIIAANNFLNPELDSEFIGDLAKQVEAEGKNYHFAKLFVQQANAKSAGQVGSIAPDFDLTDINGNRVKLSDLRGKTVILDFWATWCGPCIMSFPGMKQAMDKYQSDPNVRFLFVNTFERTPEDQWTSTVEQFIKRRGLTYLNPVLDIGSQTALTYGVDGIPAKFCVDPEGKIKYKSTGYLGSSEAVYNEMVDWVEGKK